MNRPVAAGLFALLLLLVASGVVSAGGALAAPPDEQTSLTAASAGPSSLETQGDFDRTEFEITVYENGSARWTFRYLRALNNESERQQFQDYAEEFNANETALYENFKNRSRALAQQGENVTGRNMSATGFSKRAYVEETPTGSRGVVQMSFLWTGFADASGDTVEVGDVFQGGGLYLGENQALTFAHGPNLTFYDADPSPDSKYPSGELDSAETITYSGPKNFNQGRPHVIFGPPRDSPSATDTTEGPVGPDEDGFGLLPVVGLFVVLLLGLGAVYAHRTGALDRGSGGSGGEANTDGGTGAAGVAGADAGADTTPEPAISDEELLSDEDRVLKLLEERGGRMKQVKIVEETGWSKSKVSMLLSDMEDAGQVSKLRVGRENIVSLSGHEPDAAGSPFDDEE